MTMTIETQISGEQIAGYLIDDPDEAYWMLGELAESGGESFRAALSEFAAGTTAEKIVLFLRATADAIENRD